MKVHEPISWKPWKGEKFTFFGEALQEVCDEERITTVNCCECHYQTAVEKNAAADFSQSSSSLPLSSSCRPSLPPLAFSPLPSVCRPSLLPLCLPAACLSLLSVPLLTLSSYKPSAATSAQQMDVRLCL